MVRILEKNSQRLRPVLEALLASVCKDKPLEREARVCLGEARAAARQDALMRAVAERAEAPAERLMAWKSDGASFFDV